MFLPLEFQKEFHEIELKYVKLAEKVIKYDPTISKNKFLNDIGKKNTNEYSPCFSLNKYYKKELEDFFGPGILLPNTDTHGVDAIWTNKDKTKSIEMKTMHCVPIGNDYKSKDLRDVGFFGYGQWYDVQGTWKYRNTAEQFDDDYALHVLVDSRSKLVINAVIITKEQIKEILENNMHNRYDGGSNPIQVYWRNVKDTNKYYHINPSNPPLYFIDVLEELGIVEKVRSGKKNTILKWILHLDGETTRITNSKNKSRQAVLDWFNNNPITKEKCLNIIKKELAINKIEML